MKNTVLMFIGLSGILGGIPVRAQLRVTCKLDHNIVMQYEPIQATYKIFNQSLEPLLVAKRDGDIKVSFQVKETGGPELQSVTPYLVKETKLLAPSESYNDKIDLRKVFNIREPGPLRVQAQVTYGDKIYLSVPMFVDILKGFEIQKLRGSLPGRPGEHHNYYLKTLNRGGEERLFLRIDNEKEYLCYAVIDLGTLLRFYTPVMRTDRQGKIHVLHHSTPNHFSYNVFSPQGRLDDHKTYMSMDGTIHMQTLPNGDVTVVGEEWRPIRSRVRKEYIQPLDGPIGR